MKDYNDYDYAVGMGNLIYLHPNNEDIWKDTIFISEDELPFGDDDDSDKDVGKQEIYRPLDTDFPKLSERPKEWQEYEAKYQKILKEYGLVDDDDDKKKK